MSLFSRARLAALAVVAGAALAVAPALTASAHVTVRSADAAPGGTGTLVFRVPTESDSAGTVALSVELPTDTPFRSVRAGYVPGWDVELETTALPEPVEIDGFTLTEAVSRVTWTADETVVAAGGVGPGQYAEFELRVGPFPEDGGTFYFPATQTYSDGEEVVWGEVAEEGQPEPAHPAPSLTVTGDGASSGHDSPASDAGAEAAADTGGGSDTTARVLGIVGIIVGAAGLLGGLVFGRRRSTGATAS